MQPIGHFILVTFFAKRRKNIANPKLLWSQALYAPLASPFILIFKVKMMEPEHIKVVSEEAREWVKYYSETKQQKAKGEKESIALLSSALRTTIIYMREVNEDPKIKSRNKESDLSDLWDSVANAIRPFRKDLAAKCFFKGIYWADQSRFIEAELIARRIKIHHIEMDIAEL